MTSTPSHTAPPTDGDNRTGRVGHRRLTAVQTFDIGRLTTHPVPLVPSSFIAVSGEGPKGDSNGSGKTTFLSAVSLLLADPQWKLDRDGRHARGLLFNPEAAGTGATRSGFGRGYVVGVFDAPGGSDPMTVWVRVADQPPYVQMRWTHGVHVARAHTDQERADQADELWNGIPAKQGSGANRMGTVLYGMAPRCLAYLDTSVRPLVPSLLSQQMTAMAPDAIGDALLALTGQSGLLTREVDRRSEYETAAEQLRQAETDDRRLRIEEEAHLEAVRRREEARSILLDAEGAWKLHLACGLVEKRKEHRRAERRLKEAQDALREAERQADRTRRRLQELQGDTSLAARADGAAREREALREKLTILDQDVGRLRQELEQLTKRRRDLLDATRHHDGASLQQCRTDVARAEEHHNTALVRHHEACAVLTDASRVLELVRAGHDGRTGEAIRYLGEHGVTARGVLDSVVLEEWSRPEWEAHLWRFRDSVAVHEADAESAIDMLRDLPGVSVVSLPGPVSTTPAPLFGGLSAPECFRPFLTAVRSRYGHETDPDRSRDGGLDEWVIGGFSEPLTGRESRVATALAIFEAAEQREQDSREARSVASHALRRHGERVRAAEAAEVLGRCQAERREAEGRLSEAAAQVQRMRREWTRTDLRHTQAQADLHAHELTTASLDKDLRFQDQEIRRLRSERHKADAALHHVGLRAWESAWPDGLGTAEDYVDRTCPRGEPRTSDHWWTRADHQIVTALAEIRGDRHTASQPLVELFQVPKEKNQVVPDHGSALLAFTEAIRPLFEFLEECRERDDLTKDSIIRDQREREARLVTSRKEVDEQQGRLEQMRAMIVESVEMALDSISTEFDRLDRDRDGGYGARLDVDIQDPSVTGSVWKVNATPKWLRSPQGTYVSYQEVANGAQVKVFAIHLVLAALLHDSGSSGRVLILDELGNSLGDENRKHVLRSLQDVAVRRGVTILGTCQDSVIHDAVRHCGQVVWFNHASDSEVYNRPTRTWGSDPSGGHVERVAAWLRAGRPVSG
ncbi:SMC family protein [Nocardiopsis aegyptia]|uniref:Uncharacterized protein n=1 Tax=Nocardiopsis aegyptia TaxID=220378 RepID=A0A7Z0J969_9ACTN|nr:hypothetical protein [Nocardiopsis aegyptia]NYJ33045.1 hypothetical protein [Nocardiopsis aegyptia]